MLVMSVMPGFGGQKFDPTVLPKVRALRAARPGLRVSIDGGIKPDTAADAVAAGVTQLVAGSAVFRPDGNYAAALAELARGARRGGDARRRDGPEGRRGVPTNDPGRLDPARRDRLRRAEPRPGGPRHPAQRPRPGRGRPARRRPPAPDPRRPGARGPLLRAGRERRPHRRGRRQGAGPPAQADRRPPQPRPGALAGAPDRRDQAAQPPRLPPVARRPPDRLPPAGRDRRERPGTDQGRAEAPDQAPPGRGASGWSSASRSPSSSPATSGATPASSSTTTSPPPASSGS